jgi:hypothetical protein
MSCYQFKKFIFNDGLLNNCVDVTYILYLEGNGRWNSIINQLNLYHPTSTVYIVINKGYKKCFKKNINNSVHDILITNIQIFEHALKNNYNNILVLEDDFTFSPKILERVHTNNICNFINRNNNASFCYLLGCLPCFRIPLNYNTSLAIGYVAQHSCIYSRKLYIKIIKDYYNKKILHGIDPYLALYNNFNNYMYNIPLCYQLFTETDNSNNWSKDIYNNNNIILYNLTIIAKKIFKILNLDVKYEPGYSFFYNTSLLLFYLSMIIIFIIIYKIINIYMKIK